MCVDVSPFPFGGILFQVNQPLVFGNESSSWAQMAEFFSILGALCGQDGGSTAKRGAVPPHLVMETLVFNRSIRKVSYPQSQK